MTQDDKLNHLEVTTARLDERLDRVSHDVSNTRQMVSAMGAKAEIQNAEMTNRIEALSKAILRVGLSVVAAFIMILLAIIGYFVAQKDARLEEVHYERTK